MASTANDSGRIGVGLQVGLVELDDVDARADQVAQLLVDGVGEGESQGALVAGSGRSARAG